MNIGMLFCPPMLSKGFLLLLLFSPFLPKRFVDPFSWDATVPPTEDGIQLVASNLEMPTTNIRAVDSG